MLLFNAIKESRDFSKIEVEIFTMPVQADNNPIGTTDQSRNQGKKLSEAKKSCMVNNSKMVQSVDGGCKLGNL